ncbi:uncharacterized protein FOMMEDRAFT_25739 [Fomitiporia mediterranea MF3/22]|uniref:uncharacterized protein n=1 Tax=Fomitiporia mediterranea (strain MF3/22) TaxID=694068 RepID=UPI0004407DFD|nr:uncharacterized protein FOMMEDRAFT_25739 [Fomitiporia mediterranea MF3/22]EJD06468.1 hypothetical protein FOMMEDRAFT_25739 [Fomitiporia mediterranea MF3/22]
MQRICCNIYRAKEKVDQHCSLTYLSGIDRMWTKLDSGSDDEATRPILSKDSKSRQDKTKLSLRSHLDDRKERKLSKAFDEKYQAEFHPLYLQVQSALHRLQQRKNYEDQIWNTLENGSSILPCEDQVKEYNHSCKELEKEKKDLDSIRRQSFDRLSWTSPEWDFRNSEQGIDDNMNTFCKEFNLDNNTAKDTGEELHSGQILDTQIRLYYKFILKSWEEREIDKLANYKQNIQEYPKMTADIKKRVEDERSSKKTENNERILIDAVKQLKQVEEKIKQTLEVRQTILHI